MKRHQQFNSRAASGGSVLVAVLWCVVLLSGLVIGLLHTSKLELRIAKNQGDRIRARYLALAGVEKAKALLYHEAKDRRAGYRNFQSALYDAPQYFQDVEFGGGMYRVFRQSRQDEAGPVVYGVSDEESRLNVNTASLQDLSRLPRMEPQIAAAIVDYRDSDDRLSPEGAERLEYMEMNPPYLPRNGAFLTDRELLMVRGMPRQLFLGEDANMNGLLDPEEDDGAVSEPPDNGDGLLGAGWSQMITVHSAIENVNFRGDTRVNVQTADESELSALDGMTPEIASAIVEYRNENEFNGIGDLLDVRKRAESNPNQGNRNNSSSRNSQPSQGGRNEGSSGEFTGPNLINERLLALIADDITTSSEYDLTGVVNINTADWDVLACLPGLNEDLATAIVNYRRTYGDFENVAGILSAPGVNNNVFKQVVGKICVRSETFRILSEGKVSGTGARHRIMVIARILSNDVQTLAYREDI